MNIDSYIGIKYSNRGRDRNGWDCWGCVKAFYQKEFNITLSNLGCYASSEDGEEIKEVIKCESANNWEKVSTPNAGDVVVFRMGRFPSHVGVAIGDGMFLHALKGRSTCVERLNNAIWRDRIYGFFRFGGDR